MFQQGRRTKAVSPIIATIILLAIVVTTSFGVVYWMGGITSQYAKIERIELADSSVSSKGGGDVTTWTIVINLKNTGTSPVIITDTYLNDRPLAKIGATERQNPAAGNGCWYAACSTVPSGSSASFVMVVKNGGNGQPFTSLSSGIFVNLKLQSAGGMNYLRLLELS